MYKNQSKFPNFQISHWVPFKSELIFTRWHGKKGDFSTLLFFTCLVKTKSQTLPDYKILYSNRFGIGYSASLRLINTGGRNDFFFCPLITLFLPLLSRNNWPLLWVNLSVLGTMVRFFYQINWRTWVTFEPWLRLKNSNHGYVDFL